MVPDEVVALAISAQNVRTLLDGGFAGRPLPGTLAGDVFEMLNEDARFAPAFCKNWKGR